MRLYEILSIRRLAENIVELNIYAPNVARHCLAGQFVILRVDEDGERVPFTVCDYSREAGSVCILVQTVGATTKKLSAMRVGDALADLAGPLGKPTDLAPYKNICLVGGGIGAAVIFPQAKQLCREGKAADVILGARNRDLIIYREQFREYARELCIATDDGSEGVKGFVTDILRARRDRGYDCVFAVGPLNMMKATSALTAEMGVHTVVSMNPIMVDGTGMCGCCRLRVDGKVRYACIDGPEFDGHKVDFDEVIARNNTYKAFEREHMCRLRGGYEN